MPAAKTAVKKAPAAKPVKKQEHRVIKYEDKSPGQPPLAEIFSGLRQTMLANVTGSLYVPVDKPGQLHLHAKKETEIMGKKRSELCFASLLVQKGYVGFYLMPVYGNEAMKKQLAPELLKCLKGQTCFHIKKFDETLKQQVNSALQAGYACFKKKGWA